MTYTNPAVSDFETFFARDFPFGTDPTANVLDSDVAKAFTFTNSKINPDFYPTQADYTNGYMLLAAHYLTLNLRASTQGLSGQWGWLQSGKSAGSVSESFSIPQYILDNPVFSMFSKTNYGAQYLFDLLPYLSGNVASVCGRTKP